MLKVGTIERCHHPRHKSMVELSVVSMVGLTEMEQPASYGENRTYTDIT